MPWAHEMTAEELDAVRTKRLVARLKCVLSRAESGQKLSRCGCDSSSTSVTELGECIRCSGTGFVTELPADHKPLLSSLTPEDWKTLYACEREYLQDPRG